MSSKSSRQTVKKKSGAGKAETKNSQAAKTISKTDSKTNSKRGAPDAVTSKGASKNASEGVKKAATKVATKVAGVKGEAKNSGTRRRAAAASFVPSMLGAGFDMDRCLAVKDEWAGQLLLPNYNVDTVAAGALSAAPSPAPDDNVVGVGLGEKIVGGIHTGILALKFLVRVKYNREQLSSSDELPPSVSGMPTDVEQVGTFRSFNSPLVATPDPRSRLLPAAPGCSVGFRPPPGQPPMAGTFGALVRRAQRHFILSNNHILADENQLGQNAPTFQPGFLDAGSPPNNAPIAALSAFSQLQTNGFNFVDCAISEVADPSLVTNSILRIGPPTGTTAARDKMPVHKFGRTTGYRVGFVDSTAMDVRVTYGIGTLRFRNQIIIKGLNGQQFSTNGDSGALVVEHGTNRATGLLIAGSTTHTIANHIADVLQALNVRLA
ncbi:MAG: hypothetical protein QOG00_3926 [Pyrinomonadaceae bacterium]|nr:hypothetical protein [Pyrinomonadaceae bacterium]